MAETTEFQSNLAAYKADLARQLREMQSEYDKAVMTLAGGGLGLSMTFLKDIIGNHPPLHIWSIIIAWICWASSLTVMLMGFLFSKNAFSRAISQVDQHTIYYQAPGGWHDKITGLLNPLGGILFVLGLILFGFFVISNLQK